MLLAACLVPAIAFGLLVWAFIKTKMKLKKPYCRDCGADLGEEDTETCPHCGQLIVQPDDDTLDDFDD